jgi:hypothetical protein
MVEAEHKEWRCFHCGEVFTDRQAAADHFGVQIDGCADDVACKINATDGLLVSTLREAQAELRQYHEENNAAFREFYALGAEHAVALRREEEKGYARGLGDYNKLADLAIEACKEMGCFCPGDSLDGDGSCVMCRLSAVVSKYAPKAEPATGSGA